MGDNMSFEWINENSLKFLNNGYLLPDEDAKTRIREIADSAQNLLKIKGFADKFYDYMGRGFYSLSSPVWANFGRTRGLPISCNGSYLGDDMASILTTLSEVGMQTKHGAGTSGYFGNIRPRGTPINSGGVADGPVAFMRMFETMMDVVSQGNVRRGSFAAYLDIDHPDIEEFLEVREVGNEIQNMSIGVCISDAWMNGLIAEGDAIKQKTISSSDAKKVQLWAKVLRKRKETGYPYIFFSDNVNNNKPQVLKDKDYTVWASNLCAEVCHPSSDIWSFVCCLASMNVLKWDEWKETDAVEVLTYFLDAVMEEYIQKTDKIQHMKTSNNFARHWRALGIGQLGWHTLLQSKMIPFESYEAMTLTAQIAEFMDEKSMKASQELAQLFGEPDGMKGYGQRNLTRLAIAPTTSSSFICGQVSPSIEPLIANYFVKNLAKGSFTYVNPYLKNVLETYGKDTDEVWENIRDNRGSVQHLGFLSHHEKEVFKTFEEISPMAIIQQAAVRQQFIDQSQSLNLMIPHNTPMKDINALLIEAWKLGIKTLYYQRSTNVAQETARSILQCIACEA
jgi:ribonucleoside-diphosphate reductase alpha chain